MNPADRELLVLKGRYDELIREALRLQIQLGAPLDPLGVACNTGTSCCAGDGKVLDDRELVMPAEALRR